MQFEEELANLQPWSKLRSLNKTRNFQLRRQRVNGRLRGLRTTEPTRLSTLLLGYCRNDAWRRLSRKFSERRSIIQSLRETDNGMQREHRHDTNGHSETRGLNQELAVKTASQVFTKKFPKIYISHGE